MVRTFKSQIQHSNQEARMAQNRPDKADILNNFYLNRWAQVYTGMAWYAQVSAADCW